MRVLAERAIEMDRSGAWPAEQLRLCGEEGVFEWFLDPHWGGQGWSDEQVVRGYLALSAACVTTTFIITQRTGACRRIEGCENETLKQRLLPGLASGELFATVGISHLTTSRRHLGKPVLTAEAIAGGFRLNGMSPWVTGGAAADVIVMAATLVDGDEATDRQLLIAVPTDLPGVRVAEPLPLIGVSASSTGPVHLDGCRSLERVADRRAGCERHGERTRCQHGRIRNIDAGHRAGAGGDRFSGRGSGAARRFDRSRWPRCERSTMR